jgi:60 kDa SS-A/Ro ribonucleoprotein
MFNMSHHYRQASLRGAPRPHSRGAAALSRRTTKLASVAAHVSQTQKLRAEQVQNHAGGFVFELSDMKRLHRFLVLGCEGGTYYASEKKLGVENAQCIQRLIAANKGADVVSTIVEFSTENRCPKQDTLLFGLALCARSQEQATHEAAFAAVSEVCRIPTHLFTFLEYYKLLGETGRGQGRVFRQAVAKFYCARQPSSLAFLCTKFGTRNGWSHRDVLRLAHVKPPTAAHNLVLHYLARGMKSATLSLQAEIGAADVRLAAEVAEVTAEEPVDARVSNDEHKAFDKALQTIRAIEQLKACKDVSQAVDLITAHNLAREHVPTQLLNAVPVWQSMLAHMPMTALIRNLGKMTSIGLLTPGNEYSQAVVAKLTNAEQLRAARVHPFSVLLAKLTYSQGSGDRGSLTWNTVPEIDSALESAYYASFQTVTPTGKRFCLAIDVSGSMTMSGMCGTRSMTPRLASAAMAMVTARTESHSTFMAFSSGFVPLPITGQHSLQQVVDVMDGMPFDSTDCSRPMLWALENGLPFDVFVVYTDNETYHGHVHPCQALRQYRERMGIDAKLIVVGMTATQFSIADPQDAGMLDVVGFDASAPEIMSAFVSGQL